MQTGACLCANGLTDGRPIYLAGLLMVRLFVLLFRLVALHPVFGVLAIPCEAMVQRLRHSLKSAGMVTQGCRA